LFVLSVFSYIKTVEKNKELNKLHTVKNKLFSVVAHDLRSPISSLMSLLKLVNMKKLDPETQTTIFMDISKRVENVFRLLDNLLRWAKSQMQGIVLSPVYFDVQGEVHEVIDSLQNVAEAKDISLKTHVEKQEVFADRDMFSVIVRNLTSNALKFTAEEGEVTINSEISDNMLVISVTDTGTGMTPETLKNLFNLTKTVSVLGTNNESGTGLGLLLCSDFVKANGGDIWVSSKQGEGSKFSFSIPLKKM
jgi:signal transduction histidine kinase